MGQIPKDFDVARPGARNAGRSQATSAPASSSAPSSESTASQAFSELSLAPSASTQRTTPSPAPAKDEFWTREEVDDVVSGIRFMTADEYKASCHDWALEWAV